MHRPHTVDDAVGKLGGDDFAPQAVAGNLGPERLAHFDRERSDQILLQYRIIDHIAVFQRLLQRQLGGGQQHGQFGAGEPLPGSGTTGIILGAGKARGLAIKVARFFQHVDQPGKRRHRAGTAAAGDRQAQRLKAVVLKHQMRDRIGHAQQQRHAIILGQLARTLGIGQRDLDIDLVVRTIDARRIVDEVGVDPAAMQRELDTPGLRGAKVGAFADHPRTHFVARNAQAVVGRIAHGNVVLGAGLHISADAAEPQQIDPAFQDRGNQRIGIDFADGEIQHRAHFIGKRNRLHRARKHAAPGRDQRLVVIIPA